MIDPNDAIDALVALIDTNRASLLSGLEKNGEARKIHHLVGHALIDPRAYYAIMVYLPEFSLAPATNSRNVDRKELGYLVNIAIADYAFAQRNETNTYDTMARDFNTIVGRIVALLVDSENNQQNISGASSTYQIPEGSTIRAQNLSGFTETEDGLNALLYAVIDFRIRSC